MTEENTTLNTDIDLSVAGGSSALDDPQIDPASDNLDNTGNDPAEDVVTDPEEAKKTEDTDGDTDGKLSGQEDRFDKHPRFQELRQEVADAKEAKARLEGENAALKGSTTPTPKPPYKDIMAMSEEDILDQLAENPQSFLKNFAVQVAMETSQYIENGMAQKNQSTKTTETIEQYRKDNPDFESMWETGELQKYMDSHPGHNAISAHQMLTSESKTQKIVEEAVAKKEKQIIADYKAKRSASVLGGGPSSSIGTPKIAAELKETKKHGGLNTVIANRLARMRAA